MMPQLYFNTLRIPKSQLANSPLPHLVGGKILQNGLIFHLGEEEELFEGYGARPTSYPYPQQDNYNRETTLTDEVTAVLENDFIKAVFLPQLGGRLWRLEDKQSGKNLLYTNDVIRFSNLAGCNAWFSGGVEWNVGVIGHSPFTNAPLYCAETTTAEGWPVLRMYEYERVRGVAWQMDFWLRPDSRSLNCRMRITNESSHVLPMYWWSNIAVPEFEGGRIVMPADSAYRYTLNEEGCGVVDRTSIPCVDGTDISYYKNIKTQVDYFFDLDQNAPHYIANIDSNGFGLLHLSTKRLQSRKLFSWGSNVGSNNWKRFLTENAGRYVEIQAGLAKTQYGCTPMPPHTAWEWMEQYGPIQLSPSLSWNDLQAQATSVASEQLKSENLESVLQKTKSMAKTPTVHRLNGSPYSAFCSALRQGQTDRPLASHLDFGPCEGAMASWMNFMQTGILHCPDPYSPPDAFFCEDEVFKQLSRSIDKNHQNWYAWYQLGIMLINQGNYKKALVCLETSLELTDSPWVSHALACLHLLTGDYKRSSHFMEHGCLLNWKDLSYLKEGLRLLLLAEDAQAVLRIIDNLPDSLGCNKRILLYKAHALEKIGHLEEAFTLLNENGGLVPDDIREGDDSLECLWLRLNQKLNAQQTIPTKICFRSL